LTLRSWTRRRCGTWSPCSSQLWRRNLTNFKTLLGKKETEDFLHDDDIPRLYKYFKMNAPIKDGKPVLTSER
jgi:hypothetical protein